MSFLGFTQAPSQQRKPSWHAGQVPPELLDALPEELVVVPEEEVVELPPEPPPPTTTFPPQADTSTAPTAPSVKIKRVPRNNIRPPGRRIDRGHVKESLTFQALRRTPPSDFDTASVIRRGLSISR
jgi:hypothetical protein